MQWFIDNRPEFRESLQKFDYFLRDSLISVVAGPRFEPARLRVLVTWPCYGYAALQLADRIGENVVVTETRVRIPLGPPNVWVDVLCSGFEERSKVLQTRNRVSRLAAQ